MVGTVFCAKQRGSFAGCGVAGKELAPRAAQPGKPLGPGLGSVEKLGLLAVESYFWLVLNGPYSPDCASSAVLARSAATCVSRNNSVLTGQNATASPPANSGYLPFPCSGNSGLAGSF